MSAHALPACLRLSCRDWRTWQAWRACRLASLRRTESREVEAKYSPQSPDWATYRAFPTPFPTRGDEILYPANRPSVRSPPVLSRPPRPDRRDHTSESGLEAVSPLWYNFVVRRWAMIRVANLFFHWSIYHERSSLVLIVIVIRKSHDNDTSRRRHDATIVHQALRSGCGRSIGPFLDRAQRPRGGQR